MTATSDRLAKWRDSYPERLAVLRPFLMRLMGVPRDAQSPIALGAVEQTVDAVLCAVYGVELDPVPEPPLPPPPVKAAVPKALHLEEVPLTGRDRAAGVER